MFKEVFIIVCYCRRKNKIVYLNLIESYHIKKLMSSLDPNGTAKPGTYDGDPVRTRQAGLNDPSTFVQCAWLARSEARRENLLDAAMQAEPAGSHIARCRLGVD